MRTSNVANAMPLDPIAPGAAHRLLRWNLVLAALHGVQAVVILALSFAKDPVVSSPVISSYLAFDEATRTLVPSQQDLFALPIGPAVASFFLLSSVAHFVVAVPARGWYERHLARGQNPARWIEYAFSSSVMIVVIGALTGISEIGTLVAIFGVNAAMILFGWSMEIANEGRTRVQWLHYVFGTIAGAVPWIVIGIALLTGIAAPGAAAVPGFVIAIYVSLFLTFNVFSINMILQYGRIGRWRDYLYGERAYMFFSLVAKSLLAWQVFAGTLRP